MMMGWIWHAVIHGAAALVALTSTAPAAKHSCGSLEQCVEAKRVEFERRGTFGMACTFRRVETAQGAIGHFAVGGVAPNLAGARAGIQDGDVIIRINESPLPADEEKATRILALVKPGDVMTFTVQRGREIKKYRLTADIPTPEIVEGLLLHYVWKNFSEEEFQRFRDELQAKQQKP